MRRALVSGVGQSAVGKLPDSTCMGLHLEVAAEAIADAGEKSGGDPAQAAREEAERLRATAWALA